MRRVGCLVLPAGIALGLTAESHLYGLGDTRLWIPDAAVGWTLIACGFVAWWRRPASWTGALMIAAGGAWFAGNFAAQAVYLHRAVLIQLVLAYPTGSLRSRFLRVAVACAYACSLVPAVWRDEAVAIALSVTLVAVAGTAHVRAPARERRLRLRALSATALLAVVFAGTATARLLWTTDSGANATLAAYQLGLGLLALGLTVALLTAASPRSALTDLVVELGQGDSGTVQGALAKAVGDPTLQIGFAAAGGGYFDDSGRRLEVSAMATGRRITPLGRSAILVHDASLLDDPALTEAIDAAAQLGVANARLQAELRVQLDEVQASRRRLVRAGDEQRRRLAERLHEGAERRLNALRTALGRARRDSSASADTVAEIERAEAQLVEMLTELRELAAGLHPQALTNGGLQAALSALVARCPLPVELAVGNARFATDLERAGYFVCSEALANVVKYARATHASVSVAADDGTLSIEIEDNGVGGAAAAQGTGLRGLTDRIETLGGELTIESPPGVGTRLTARLPLS